MRIEHLHKSISQMKWDELVSFILEMRNRRRTVSEPIKTKTTKAKNGGKNKKQPKEYDLFAVANTMKQSQKNDLLAQLQLLMGDDDET